MLLPLGIIARGFLRCLQILALTTLDPEGSTLPGQYSSEHTAAH